MQIKVYIVIEEGESGSEVIAAKLTFSAARAVAKLKGRRRVIRLVADKIPAMTYDFAEQHKGEQHGVNRIGP